MKAFETAPPAHQQPASNFYPLPQMVMPPTGLDDSDEDKSAVVMAAANQRRNRQKKQQYLDMPRSSDPDVLNFAAGGLTASEVLVGDGEDDQQIREMENLLAEIGQDVSELKVSQSHIIFEFGSI